MNKLIPNILYVSTALLILNSQTIGGTLDKKASFQFPITIFDGDSVGGSDVWGWTGDDGTEYAIMGVLGGVAFVNTTTMEVITTVPGPTEANPLGPYHHRDIKTYRHYAYVVSENTGVNEGLMVIDLQGLPNSVEFIGSFPIDGGMGFQSHNISIDTAKGFAYLEGNSSNWVTILDLSNPESPQFVNGFNGNRIHDLYARNDTVYLAEGKSPYFSIWDLTDKNNPVRLLRKEIPNPGLVHTIWPTDDGKYVVTTEETAGKKVKIWDVSNYDSVFIAGEWLGASNLAHNAQVMGDLLFVSHYQSGVSVVDISDPTDPVEIANFDTYLPGNLPQFNGCWGVYQYTSDGTIFTSDLEGRLTVMNFDRFAVGVGHEINALPSQPLLIGNYPNPFNPQTTIEFYLPEAGSVNLSLFNLKGELGQVIVDGHLVAGHHAYSWSGRETAAGIYFYRLITDHAVKSGKMLLIK
ncbi:MAG: choice-of-anchor B family protein [Candidatus Marinimicrobia bacterium]|nr:choice-of-anchor B family protein [Candidatus Neomarinimicrobiota bacterium]